MKTILLISTTIFALGMSAFGQNPPTLLPPATPIEPATTPPLNRAKTAATLMTQAYGAGLIGGGNYYGNGGAGLGPGNSSGIPPVVVRFSEGEDDTISALEEDLNIMTHVIEGALQHGIGEETPEVRSGIPILFSDGRSVRGMYLDGFGALFMIKVRFPVFAPSAPEPKEAQPAADTEWDKAKRDLYAETEQRSAEMTLVSGGSQYNAEQVEELKKVLLQTLKNAANIHNLKPDDFIAITVFGQPSTPVQIRKSRAKSSTSNTPGQNAPPARGEASSPRKSSVDVAAEDQKLQAGAAARQVDLLRAPSQGTVLALRARKSDVDAFANGKLNFTAFKQKAQQHSYPGNGYGITSINSWSRSRGAAGGASR